MGDHPLHLQNVCVCCIGSKPYGSRAEQEKTSLIVKLVQGPRHEEVDLG